MKRATLRPRSAFNGAAVDYNNTPPLEPITPGTSPLARVPGYPPDCKNRTSQSFTDLATSSTAAPLRTSS